MRAGGGRRGTWGDVYGRLEVRGCDVCHST